MDKLDVPIRRASNYKVKFTTLDGMRHTKTFKWYQSVCLGSWLRPHSPSGINFIEDGEFVFIPWHQVKRSSFAEDIIGEEAS